MNMILKIYVWYEELDDKSSEKLDDTTTKKLVNAAPKEVVDTQLEDD